MLISKAIALAASAHDEQLDKGGEPYIFHPIRVMINAEGDENVKCTAVLHDILEDTRLTEDDLRSEGFDEEIITALKLLTRNNGDNYMEYIKRLKPNKIARAVKLADLADNMDMTRIKNPTEQDFKRLEKYKKAKEILEN